MKPPARAPHWDGDGFVHWDLSEEILRQPLHLRVQGELLLEDMPPNAGGFQCIGGFHLRTPDWVAQQPEERCHDCQTKRSFASVLELMVPVRFDLNLCRGHQ